MTREASEDERSRMLFSKLRQVVSQKFGYGVKEHKAFRRVLGTINPTDMNMYLKNGALFFIKGKYREILRQGGTAIVTVEQGRLRGRKCTSVLGKAYYSFLGVPYAKPPTGALRFKDPQPAEPWTGVRNALKHESMSLQADVITGLIIGSENCLYLNIFTPQLPLDGSETERKAVMVWIHGGAFQLGSGNSEIYGPDFFLDDDVVLVTLNYRLGVMGFLSTGTDDAPGNAGLKDILQALKWIQQNIAVFGGDPAKVTIFGESAGGAAVQYLMLSPLAKGLFSRAISQSGSAISPWAFSVEPHEAAFKLGRAFGLETKDPKVLVDFLKKISPKVLTKKQTAAISEKNKLECFPFPFLPCIESPSPQAFITENPLKILRNNGPVIDVPYIAGINRLEGAIMLKPIIDKLLPYKDIDEDMERLVPRFLDLHYGSNDSKKVAQKIREHYFHNKKFDKHTHQEFIDLTTDIYFLWGMYESTKLHNRFCKSPIFNYYFVFDGNFAFLKRFLYAQNIPGPVHADELGYLFHIPILGPSIDLKSSEMKVSKKMVRLWTNFAKYGNPTPFSDDSNLESLLWKAHTDTDRNCLVIAENFTMETNIRQEKMNFWNDIESNL